MSDDEIRSPRKRVKEENDDDSDNLHVDPSTIDRFCDSANVLFKTANDVKTMKLSHVFRSKPMQEDESMQEFDRVNGTTRSEIQHAFQVYYRKASQTNVVTAETAMVVVKAYVNSGESIEMHPRFPQNPMSAYNLYLKDQNVAKFDKNDEVRQKFGQDPKIKKKYEELFKVKLQEHVVELKKFLKNEEDLKDEHIKFVTNRIRVYERKIDPKSVQKQKRGPTKKKPKKNFKTAFDYFKQSKSTSYTDLDAEAREKKLLKKFNRLSDEMRQIFDDLEQSQYKK